MIIIYSEDSIESTYGHGSKPSMVARWYPDGYSRSHMVRSMGFDPSPYTPSPKHIQVYR